MPNSQGFIEDREAMTVRIFEHVMQRINGQIETVMNEQTYQAQECQRCHELTRADHIDTVRVNVGYGREAFQEWCWICTDNNAFTCNGDEDNDCGYTSREIRSDCECGDHCMVHENDCEREDRYDDEPRSRTIHSYGYKPSANFHNSTKEVQTLNYRELQQLPYFGIELEQEQRSTRYSVEDAATRFSEIMNGNEAYLKYDGSLNEGFELVSHPKSLDAWYESMPKWEEMLKALSQMGMRAWNRSNCGLHVHISRRAFKSTSHMTRFGLLFTKNQEKWYEVAHRQSSYASFQGMAYYGESMPTKMNRLKYGGYVSNHSDAVNFNGNDGSSTIEVRIFRPSLAIGRVIGSIELVHSAWAYTKDLTAKDVMNGAINFSRYSDWLLGREEYTNAVRIIADERFSMEREGIECA